MYEPIVFIVIGGLILLVFIIGIFLFFYKYYQRRLEFEKEKAAADELHAKELFYSNIAVQQQTMQDIGRDIHDNIGQKLTLASLYTNTMAYQNEYPALNEQITTVGKIIDESIHELRALAKSLTNENTDMAELMAMLNNECARINALQMCHIVFTFDDTNFSISTTVKNFIIRIIQEFVQNSLKHAHCKNMQLDFQRLPAGLAICIADDGVGFDMEANKENAYSGIGLGNMKKRAELIGADFSMNSIKDKGTTLNLFIPVNKLTVN